MSNELDPTINGRPISELKVVELKEELSKRGLSKAGNKNVLYDRLKKFLLDESGEANVTLESLDTSQTSDTPNSPPANPLVAEYLAKQEAALREARKDAEAALRSSSGDEASPPPKKILRSRKAIVSSGDSEDTVIERRTTRSKTRSEAEQVQESVKTAAKLTEARRDVRTSVNEVDSAIGGPGDALDTGLACKKPEGTESGDSAKKHAETAKKTGQNIVGEVIPEVQRTSEVAAPSGLTDAIDHDTKDKTNLAVVPDASTVDSTPDADVIAEAAHVVSDDSAVPKTGAALEVHSTPVLDTNADVTSVTDDNIGISIPHTANNADIKHDGIVAANAIPTTTASDPGANINIAPVTAAGVNDKASDNVQILAEESSRADEKKNNEVTEEGTEVAKSEVKTIEKEGEADVSYSLEHAEKQVQEIDEDARSVQRDKQQSAEDVEMKLDNKMEEQSNSESIAIADSAPDAVKDGTTHAVATTDLELPEADKDVVEETVLTSSQQPQTSHSEPEVVVAESSTASEKMLEEQNFGDVVKVERKRRWKETSSQDGSDDKDVITISATKNEVIPEPDESECSDVDDKSNTNDQQHMFEAKEAMLGTGEKDEELDYEEALEHISPTSESSKPLKPDDDEPPKKIRNEEAENEYNTVTTEFERRREVLNKKRTSETLSNSQEKHGVSEDGSKRRKVSPARYPVSEYLLIRQLTRPFTVKQLKGMLSNYGTLVEDGFWIDNIKSKCIVKYSSKEEATVARGSLHNLVWPLGNPKELKVDFIDEAGFTRFSKQDLKEDIKGKTNGGTAAQPSVSLRVSAGNDQRYVQKRQEGQGGSQETAVRSTTKSDRSPSSRHESGHCHDSSMKRQENVRTPVDYHKNEPETKAKTADELFQKTKTQPAIYFSPLTDEQVLERAKQKSAETESSVLKRAAQASRNERHKNEDSEKDGKYRLSPWRRQKSPAGQKRRRSSRSRSPRRP